MFNDILPAEILDDIFSHLTPPLDDSIAHDLDEVPTKRDLVACALTCRAWCVRARPYLFRSLEFSFRDTEMEEENVRRIQIGSQSFPNIPFKALKEFLTSHPHIGNYICHVSLRCYPHEIAFVQRMNTPAPVCAYVYRERDTIPLGALRDTLTLLPRLKMLSLSDVVLTPETPPCTAPAGLPPLERLSIQRFYRHNLSFPLDDLLAHFGPIRSLALTNIDLPPASPLDAPPLRVESLTVRGGGASHVLPPRLDAFVLRTLDLGHVHPQHDRWLCALAPYIHTFGCTLSAGIGPFGPWPYVHDLPHTLAPLFAIRTLALRVVDGALDGWPAHLLALERAVVLLDSLAVCVPEAESSHPYLTDINFVFDAPVDLASYDKPCRDIEDAVLRLMARSNLKKVDVAMPGEEKHWEHVRKAFPCLEEMGVLGVRRVSARPVEMVKRLGW